MLVHACSCFVPTIAEDQCMCKCVESAGASGIAGIMSLVLMMKHQQLLKLCPSSFQLPRTDVNWDSLGVLVLLEQGFCLERSAVFPCYVSKMPGKQKECSRVMKAFCHFVTSLFLTTEPRHFSPGRGWALERARRVRKLLWIWRCQLRLWLRTSARN